MLEVEVESNLGGQGPRKNHRCPKLPRTHSEAPLLLSPYEVGMNQGRQAA